MKLVKIWVAGLEKYKKKTLPQRSGREMKKVADTSEPPVVIPIVVVTVDVHVALVIVPAVEGDHLYKVPSVTPLLEYSQS